jgi:3-methyl-2-oxobutanoate hydroxymethyltransferase
MSAIIKDAKRITTHTIQEMKQAGVPISMLTSYDYSMARIFRCRWN